MTRHRTIACEYNQSTWTSFVVCGQTTTFPDRFHTVHHANKDFVETKPTLRLEETRRFQNQYGITVNVLYASLSDSPLHVGKLVKWVWKPKLLKWSHFQLSRGTLWSRSSARCQEEALVSELEQSSPTSVLAVTKFLCNIKGRKLRGLSSHGRCSYGSRTG